MTTTSITTKFEIRSWDEKPYRELPDGSKFTRAEVALAATGDELAGEASWEALMYYAPDGTSSYVGLMRIDGRLAGRAGTVVLSGSGGYDGTTARGESTVVAGTGGLAGITGTSTSESTHADYPYMPFRLEYALG